MPDRCMKMAGGTVIRTTLLDECGNIGSCYVVSKCIATVQITEEYVDPTDLSPPNMDGTLCWVFETPPQLKWERYTITANAVDVRMWNMLTGAPLYFNEAAPTPEAVGVSTTRDQILMANAAVELWLRQAGEVCAPGLTPYVYWVSPWITQGRIGERTVGNVVTNFVVEQARSGVTSPWGVGPYNVERNAITAVPRPLLTPFVTNVPGEEELSRQLVTTLAPPPPSCGCQDPTPALAVSPAGGTAPEDITITYPLGVDGVPILPARIDFDDGTPVLVVTSGTSTVHSYTVPGTYNARYTPTGYSSPDYVSADIVIT